MTDELQLPNPRGRGTRPEKRDKDITKEVSFERNDDENLPLTKCACGREYDPWNFILGMERDYPKECDCGRKLYFTLDIKVFEVEG